MNKDEYDPEEVGRIRTVGFLLVLKVYGDPGNDEGEEVLRARFERELKKLKVGDGRTRLKVSELEEMFNICFTDGDVIEVAKKRIRRRKKEYEGGAVPGSKKFEERTEAMVVAAKTKRRVAPEFSEDKKSVQFSTRHNIHEAPDGEFIT